MAFALRRATASAVRATQGLCLQNCRRYHLDFFRPLVLNGILSRAESCDFPSPSSAIALFSSYIQKPPATDVELLRIMESEIECAKAECGEVEQIPKGFPFEIQDEEGTNAITLRRDYLKESIHVVVSMPTVEEADDNEEDNNENNDNDDDGDEDDMTGQLTIPMTVNISKGEGPNLEFCCTAYVDKISIDSLCIRRNKDSDDLLAYEGPDFNDLDENLQKAFYKYLETRGISTETTKFLYQYLINKDDREYLIWLQNLKLFLEK